MGHEVCCVLQEENKEEEGHDSLIQDYKRDFFFFFFFMASIYLLSQSLGWVTGIGTEMCLNKYTLRKQV